MIASRPRLSSALTLVVGLLLGWGLANGRPPVLRAHGGDRSGESILLTGPTMIRYDDGLRAPISHDAIYYLDYKGGRLLATVPVYQGGVGSSKLLDQFAERDLVADFKLDVDRGARPRFLMTTGSIGTRSDGWSPLFVFETTTNQVAVYRVQSQSYGVENRPKFDLLEIRPISQVQASSAGGR